MDQVITTLRECLALFSPGHALDRFDWGRSSLRGQDIRELNELPTKIKAALAVLESGK